MTKKLSKSYQYFLGATFTSSLGSFAFNFAFMSFLYFESNQDKRFVALSQLFFVIGMLIGNLSGGVIAEKMEKKKLILFCEIIRIPIVAMMLLYLDNVWVLLFLHGFKTIFAGISTPLKRTYITLSNPPELIANANMGFTVAYGITQIIGPLIGTLAYYQFKELNHLIILDLITYVIAVLMLLKIDSVKIQLNDKKVQFFNDIKSGLQYVVKTNFIKGLFEKHIFVGIVSGILLPLILPFTIESLHASEREYGILMAVFGVGGVIGSILSKKIAKYFALGKIISTLCLIEPFIMLLWCSITNIYLSFLLFGIWGVLFFKRVTLQFNFLSHHVAENYLARTNSLFEFSFTLTNIVASTYISLNGKNFDTKSFLIQVATVYLVVTFLHFVLTSARSLWQHGVNNE